MPTSHRPHQRLCLWTPPKGYQPFGIPILFVYIVFRQSEADVGIRPYIRIKNMFAYENLTHTSDENCLHRSTGNINFYYNTASITAYP